MARAPSTPPAIEGFSPGRLIGVGGYADVFLYEQQLPKRNVAVKVLLADAISSEQQQRQFTAEANLMARVSTHPYIVSVFQAAVATDGRPYLVMEYYPGANYLERVRRERFSVAEVLRTAIQIASAVETAHRAGILHRDIKPANILTSEYGRPGLTDFGIAAPDEQVGDDSEGVSIPWAPPEAFGNARLDERADVYSLAATVYHLLAGRSPFEVPGGSNTPLELMSRIDRQVAPKIGRADAPASLERVLSIGMAKDPAHRPNSAAEFARLLQGVESEMKLAVTQLELIDAGRSVRPLDEPESDETTRIRGVTEIVAQGSAGSLISGVPDRPTGVAPAPARRREGMMAEPEVEETVARARGPVVPSADAEPAKNRKWMVASAVGAALTLLVVLAATLFNGGSNGSSGASIPVQVNDGFGSGVVYAGPGVVLDLKGTTNADGGYAFTWLPPAGAPTDITYQVIEKETATTKAKANPPQSTASYVSVAPCVEVYSIGAGGATSGPVPLCAGP